MMLSHVDIGILHVGTIAKTGNRGLKERETLRVINFLVNDVI